MKKEVLYAVVVAEWMRDVDATKAFLDLVEAVEAHHAPAREGMITPPWTLESVTSTIPDCPPRSCPHGCPLCVRTISARMVALRGCPSWLLFVGKEHECEYLRT